MSDDADDDTPYAVGYGKPPKETRFQPGKSGNPKGRRRGARDLRTELAEELRQPIAIRENGKHKTVSKQRAILKRLTEQSLTGDIRATHEVLALVLRVLALPPDGEEVEELSNDDQKLVDDFLDRVAKTAPKPRRPSKRSSKRKSAKKSTSAEEFTKQQADPANPETNLL